MTQHALAAQEGGNHYKGMAMQPFEFGYANCYDAPAFSVMKYVARHHLKGGREDLLKGRHIIQIRRDLRRDYPHLKHVFAIDAVPVGTFIGVNQLGAHEASILTDLHTWATGKIALPDATVADFLIQKFDVLIDSAYPQNKV